MRKQATSSINIYGLLLITWSAICIGFWSIIYWGGDALSWTMKSFLGVEPSATENALALFRNVPPVGAIMIWLMGAASLFILRRWMSGVNKGPGQIYDVKFQNDHHDVRV